MERHRIDALDLWRACADLRPRAETIPLRNRASPRRPILPAAQPRPRSHGKAPTDIRRASPERLMRALVSLDQHVEIVVEPARRTHAPGITVAA